MSPNRSPKRRIWHVLLPSLLIVLLALLLRLTGIVGSTVQAQPGSLASPRHNAEDAAEPMVADRAILWVGNSHVHSHDLPELVSRLIRFRNPDEKVAHRTISVAFLEGEEKRIKKRLDAQDWHHVILQAQKISASGRIRYPTSDGVSIAKHALAKGSRVHFYSEWGLRGDADNAAHTALVYREMAKESSAELIGVGDVWNRVLQQAPGLELYSPDGNHQSRLGASLTALTIACGLLELPASDFLEFSDPIANREQWLLFCQSIDAVKSDEAPN